MGLRSVRSGFGVLGNRNIVGMGDELLTQGTSKTEGDPTFLGYDCTLLRAFGLRRSTQFVVGHCESYSLQPSVYLEFTDSRVNIAFALGYLQQCPL